ncbi:hypothetical protein [Peribacillus phoenicis]|uniref:hypothetical protein n=1 Tax=Peribacillus sp. 1P06PA-2 TaxID=3132295 RepID=UPI0039A73E95
MNNLGDNSKSVQLVHFWILVWIFERDANRSPVIMAIYDMKGNSYVCLGNFRIQARKLLTDKAINGCPFSRSIIGSAHHLKKNMYFWEYFLDIFKTAE